MLDYIFDRTDKSVRGSFINMLITFVYLTLIVWAVFDKAVRDSLLQLNPIMTWFFATSFGIWTTKRVAEVIVSAKTDTASISTTTGSSS